MVSVLQFYNFTDFAMTLNELDDDAVAKLPPTDCRFRPDVRKMENGDIGKTTRSLIAACCFAAYPQTSILLFLSPGWDNQVLSRSNTNSAEYAVENMLKLFQ